MDQTWFIVNKVHRSIPPLFWPPLQLVFFGMCSFTWWFSHTLKELQSEIFHLHRTRSRVGPLRRAFTPSPVGFSHIHKGTRWTPDERLGHQGGHTSRRHVARTQALHRTPFDLSSWSCQRGKLVGEGLHSSGGKNLAKALSQISFYYYF